MPTVTLPTGTNIACFSTDETQFILDEIFVREVYRLPESLRTSQQPPLIVDIGANVGVFGHYALDTCPNTILHAIEPVPPIAALLRQNLAQLSPLPTIHECCIGAVTGSVPITFYPGYSILSNTGGDSSADEELLLSCIADEMARKLPPGRTPTERHLRLALGDKLASAQTFHCPMLTLDQWITENNVPRIDFLKLDAEGSEAGILASLSPHAWSLIHHTAIEVHDRPDSEDILQRVTTLLQQHGFVTRVGDRVGSTAMIYGAR